MKVAIGSAFRNMGPRAADYLERAAKLRDALALNDHTLRVIAVEGDSVDNTRQVLSTGACYHDLHLDLRTCNHGGPVFGSTEQPERLAALSKVGNAVFDGVTDDDVLVYVESDLQWDVPTMMALIADARARSDGFDVFAPLVMAGAAFYDIWGFRGMDGERWGPFSPYHLDVANKQPGQGYIEVSSAGSCLVMGGNVARVCRIRNNYGLVGWCEDARLHGYRIAARIDLIVRQA